MTFIKSITHNFRDVLITEIALDGLQGISLDLLWKRVEKCLQTPVTQKLKSRFWNFIISNESITFYLQNEPLEDVVILDRFSIIDEDSGHVADPPDFVDGPYQYCPVAGQYGSCPNFDQRSCLSKGELRKMGYDKVEENYRGRLVMVASIEERWRALASHLPITYLTMLTPVHYCMLELIGRARENGQVTIGKTNLTKIVKESKLLFYNRKHLLRLNLVKVLYFTQIIGGKSMKTILLRINRYHKPILLSLPRSGRVHDMVNYLLEQPDQCERIDVMVRKGFITSRHRRRLQKTYNVFSFQEKLVDTETSTKKKNSDRGLKRKYVCLNPMSDDDDTDDEDQAPPLKCQYKVGVGLLRQAYEVFLQAGQKGLTQVELGQLLGVEFYTTRSICRVFKTRKLIREFLEDKGRQRTARYVAITAKSDTIDQKYADEKKKFLEHLDESIEAVKNTNKRSAQESSVKKPKVPKKKTKLDENETNIETAIEETDSLGGLEGPQGSLINSKKDLTLRQLMFANGMIKIIKEKQFVTGFQTLGNMVSQEIGQPTMDTKAIKVFIQKLVADKQLKILKIQWPGPQNRFSYLICAPHVRPTDPVIKAKYKEICSKAKIPRKKREKNHGAKPMTKYTYPRYMKIQKLHEHITKLVYFNEVKNETLPPGFSTLFSIIPEMTVEFALGNISYVERNEPAIFKIDREVLGMKMKDAPKDVTNPILQSKSLQSSIRLGLKTLAMLGLIQIIERPSPSLASDDTVLFYVFYVNRYAKIVDTTGKWPRCEETRNLEKSYCFQTFEDVQSYWNDVCNISFNTFIDMNDREKFMLDFPMRHENTVLDYDTGERHGDGSGPCGFDSSIYMDMSRLWNVFLGRSVKQPKRPSKVKRTIVKKRRTKASQSKNKTVVNKIKEEGESEVATRTRTVAPKITWSARDDKIVTVCKAAMKILSPVTQPGSLTVRNLVASDLMCLSDSNKTPSAAHKRAMQLESKSIWKHKLDRILCELKRHPNVLKEYEGRLRTAKIYNSSDLSKLIEDARLPVLELVWLILQMEKNKTIRDEYECIAKDIDDFRKRYSIQLTSDSNETRSYRTAPTQELQFGVLKEAILMTVMLSYEKELSKEVAKKVYTIFKPYEEVNLRSAIAQLRKGSAIVPREKSATHLSKESFDTISQSGFKISAVYSRKWFGRLNVDFFNELATTLESEIPTVGLRGSSQLNCLFCELQVADAIELFSDSIPTITGSAGSILQEEQMNVIDMETKYKIKSGHLGWKNIKGVKVLSELFESIDLNGLFRTMSRASVVTIKTKEYDMSNEIVSYINGMGFKGCTFIELQQHLSIDQKLLAEKLSELSSQGIIKAVGYFQNVIMLMKYTKMFLLQISPNTYLEPSPWLNIKGQVQSNVFWKWAIVIITKIFECPGISVYGLSDHFECISCRSVLNACMFLEKCECVTLKTLLPLDIDLFSDDDTPLDENDFNPFCSFENIYVHPVTDFMTKFSLILPQQPKS